MRRISIILDDELEQRFDRFKAEDYRQKDAEAGRALLIRALDVHDSQAPQQPEQQAQG